MSARSTDGRWDQGSAVFSDPAFYQGEVNSTFAYLAGFDGPRLSWPVDRPELWTDFVVPTAGNRRPFGQVCISAIG